jgi:microcystin-dependent protein
MSTPYLGEIRAVGFNFVPEGWASCNGQLLSIAENDALFFLLGTTYGGDGQTSFAVPNMTGRVGVGAQGGATGPGLSNYPLGQRGGTESVTLTTAQLPSHGHPYAVPVAGSTTGTLSSNPLGKLPGSLGGTYAATAGTNQNLAANAVTNGAVGAAGGNQPHSNVQPVLAINYIIAITGIFPPQPN